MTDDIKKAYELGVQDERIRWKVALRKVLDKYDVKEWREQLRKLDKERGLL